MNTFVLSRHPIIKIEGLKRYGNLVLEFAKYRYIPKTPDKKVKIFIPIANINEPWLCETIKDLRDDEDLVLLSSLSLDGQVYHIQMIDLVLPTLNFANINIIDKHLGQMTYFFTGRSFHAYGNNLMTHEQWIKFMGNALLLNDTRAITDIRWIGHCLVQGFSGLRWTCNQSFYLQIPTLFHL